MCVCVHLSGAKGFMSYVNEEVTISRHQMAQDELQNCARLFEIERSRQGDTYDAFQHLLHSCAIGDTQMCRYLILTQGVDHTRCVTDRDIVKNRASTIHEGDTPLSVALRFDNSATALFLTTLQKNLIKSGREEMEGDVLPLLNCFASEYSHNWHHSSANYDADVHTLLGELRKKFRWVALFLRTTKDAAVAVQKVTDAMVCVPFFTPPRSIKEVQKIGLYLLDKENVNKIAEHFLIWSYQMFTRLSPSELATYPLNVGSDTVTPQLSLFSNFLNDIHRWVEVLVLSDWDAKDRARTIEMFILLGEALLQKRCYLVAIGVTFGLQSAHILR